MFDGTAIAKTVDIGLQSFHKNIVTTKLADHEDRLYPSCLMFVISYKKQVKKFIVSWLSVPFHCILLRLLKMIYAD